MVPDTEKMKCRTKAKMFVPNHIIIAADFLDNHKCFHICYFVILIDDFNVTFKSYHQIFQFTNLNKLDILFKFTKKND